MKFEHIQQHSLEGLLRIQNLARESHIPLQKALFVAEELVVHGHPAAGTPIAKLREMSRHRDVIAHADMLQRTHDKLRGFFKLETKNKSYLEPYYRKNGYLYLKNQFQNDRLLVIFTTMFNNFYISNSCLSAALSSLPCDMLILKDATLLNYQRGVDGLASDIPGIAGAIQRIARRQGKKRVYLSGYSSGGYAALLTSLLMPCHGFLGFSHQTDLSENSPLPAPRLFSDAARIHVGPASLLDCRPLLERADPSVPRIVVYGKRSERDVAHAHHLVGLDTVRLLGLPKAAHNTIQPLLASGQFLNIFRRILAAE